MHPNSSTSATDRIVITGANGQLGSQLVRLLGSSAIPLDVQDMDLTRPSEVRDTLQRLRPTVLVNTAAFTAVDDAEQRPELCHAVNHHAVATLVDQTRQLDCRIVQISTDYVFGGSHQRTPFREDAPLCPVGVYAESKAAGETEARRHPEHLIVRTCGIYGPECPNGSRNFVAAMLQLGSQRPTLNVVDDQICNPTYVVQLAKAVVYLIHRRSTGTYHVVNGDGWSWFEMAKEIFRLAQLDCQVQPISTAEYNAPAPRPAFSILETSKYAASGGPAMSSCRDALADFLASQRISTR